MLRAAERLASIDDGQIVAWLMAENEAALAAIEGQARLLLADREDVRMELADIARLTPAAMAESLRRLQPGFVVAQFGGMIIPSEGDLKPLAAGLECPLLLVR